MPLNPPINKAFEPLWTTDRRYTLLTGGRGSLKSSTVSNWLVEQLCLPDNFILFSRFTMNSAEKSIMPEVFAAIDRYDLKDVFKKSGNDIINQYTGSFVSFTGLKEGSKTNTARLKGINAYNIWVVDEAEEFVDELSFDRVDDSIRKTELVDGELVDKNRVVMIMNPTTDAHWIYKRWFSKTYTHKEYHGYQVQMSTHPMVTHIHTTFHIAKNFLPKSWLDKEREFRELAEDKAMPKLENESHRIRYFNNYIGGWIDVAEGAVFKNWRIGKFDDTLPFIYGQDYGFSDHPTTLVKVAVDERKKIIYAKEIYGSPGLSTQDIANLNNKYAIGAPIIADGSQDRLISELIQRGNKIYKADRRPHTVVPQITTMQCYTLVLEGVNLIDNAKKYKWKVGKEVVDKVDDDYLDGVRYGFAALSTKSRSPRFN